MADRDVTQPQDNDVISAYPANERAQRSAQSTIFDVEHFDPDDADQGRHRQVSLKALGVAPGGLTGYGRMFTQDVDGITELFYLDDNGSTIQLTNDGNIKNAVVNMPVQSSDPAVPVNAGHLYTKEFNGIPELFWQDELGNTVRFTFKGELNIDLSETDIIVGSLRTNNFFRGRRRTIASVLGLLEFDFESATIFETTITENTVGTLVNMPDAADGEEQTMLIDITDGGNFTTALASTYTIIRPGGVVKPFTVDGRDLIILTTHDGLTIMSDTITDFS